MIVYTKEDYMNVEDLNFNQFQYLDSTTINMISSLTEQVSAPTYIKTPIFPITTDKSTSQHEKISSESHTYNSSSKIRNPAYNSNGKILSQGARKLGTYGSSNNKEKEERGGWRKPGFQATKLTREKSGIKGKLEEIRLLLNKLTDKTYKKISDQLLDLINDSNDNLNSDVKEKEKEKLLCASKNTTVDSDNLCDDDLNDICKMVCAVASTNFMNSKTYADILHDMKESLKLHNSNVISQMVSNYMNSYESLLNVFTSPDKDYDNFCVINLQNTKRKGTTSFICFLYDKLLLCKDDVYNVVKHMTDLLKSNYSNEISVTCNDEIAENLFIYSKHLLFTNDNTDIIELINKDIQLYISSKHTGISHKAKFKFMDIRDLLQKHK